MEHVKINTLCKII